jgi:CRISPR-associated protein Cst2
MDNKGLTMSMIFESFGANYGEGCQNISTLKKVLRGDGNMYSYISRQALRYNMVRQSQWDNTPVDDAQKVVQFAADASIEDYPEIDLFGYMKTKSGGAVTRSAVARVGHAVALEPFNGEIDFQTNIALARRKGLANAIAQSEIQRSFYAYTLTIDLDLVGEEKDASGKNAVSISNEEKAERVVALLNTVQYLYRDVKGRRENLSPLFAVGGVYDRKTPFFDGRLVMRKGNLETKIIKSIISGDPMISSNTMVGYTDGIFPNSAEIKSALAPVPVPEFFNLITSAVRGYYQ